MIAITLLPMKRHWSILDCTMPHISIMEVIYFQKALGIWRNPLIVFFNFKTLFLPLFTFTPKPQGISIKTFSSSPKLACRKAAVTSPCLDLSPSNTSTMSINLTVVHWTTGACVSKKSFLRVACHLEHRNEPRKFWLNHLGRDSIWTPMLT